MTCIKICGITSLKDALCAIEAGADMLGFNFYPPSPRAIEPDDCFKITSVLEKEKPNISRVGVFVNMPVGEINSIMQKCLLHCAQLHGDESPGELALLNGIAYKAFRGHPQNKTLEEYMKASPGIKPAFLLDAAVSGVFGGSGILGDWSSAASLGQKYKFLLAGGIKSENVAEAIYRVHPWGLDTASGVESKPGKKDPIKMKDFISIVKSIDFVLINQ